MHFEKSSDVVSLDLSTDNIYIPIRKYHGGESIGKQIYDVVKKYRTCSANEG